MTTARLSTVMFATASVVALVAAWRPTAPAPCFVLGGSAPTDAPALFTSCFLPKPPDTPKLHSCTLAVLPAGERLAIWFGGTDEAQPDVSLFQSHFRNGAWQPPRRIMTPEETSSAVGRYVRRLGNPALHRDASGRLHLFYVSVSFGGWACSSISHMMSHDAGETWSSPRRIITSPFFNLSTLVRHPGIPLTDGGFYLPVYHELAKKYPELLQFDRDGRLVRKVRMAEHGALQPVLVPTAAQSALSFLRNRFLGSQVLCQQTQDGGRHWSTPASLALENPDAPVAAGRLADGAFVLVYNPSRAGRNTLALAVSRDGRDWRTLTTLEHDDGDAEFSYPTLLIDGDVIDVMYTWKRHHIKHVRFNAAWIQERCHG